MLCMAQQREEISKDQKFLAMKQTSLQEEDSSSPEVFRKVLGGHLLGSHWRQVFIGREAT